MVPAGLQGLATISPSGRRVEPVQHRHARLEAGLRPGLQDHRLHAERGEDVHVGRVERRSQRDPVAWIERGQERQRESRRTRRP